MKEHKKVNIDHFGKNIANIANKVRTCFHCNGSVGKSGKKYGVRSGKNKLCNRQRHITP